MAKREPAPDWRNALSWAAMVFVFIGAAMAGVISLLRPGGLGSVLGSAPDLARVTAALILGTGLVTLGQRKVPFNPANLLRFVLWCGLAIALVLVIKAGLDAMAGRLHLNAMGLSARIALFIGLGLLFFAVFGLLMLAAAHVYGRLLTPEQGETLLENRRVTILSLIAVTAMGLTLILLSLAGPGGVVPPAALAGMLVLIGVRITLSVAVWRRVDELSKTLSRETGHAAFYLVLGVGGGWAILAHLGFAPAPAPLDWLSLFTVILFAAGFISAGRRGLLSSR